MNGKGSKSRVRDYKKYSENYDDIFRKNEAPDIIPPGLVKELEKLSKIKDLSDQISFN